MESPIEEFYKNKSVLLTGFSGFLGQIITERLVRCCDVDKIYVLIRNKKGKTWQNRVYDIFKDPVSILICVLLKQILVCIFFNSFLIAFEKKSPILRKKSLEWLGIVIWLSEYFVCMTTGIYSQFQTFLVSECAQKI